MVLLGVPQGMMFGFNYIEKKINCSKLNAIFIVVIMNFSCKFGAWVNFHAAILQS